MAAAHLLRHPLSLEHDTGPHPENAGRIEAIESTLEPLGWCGLEPVEAPEATREQLERVHSLAHIERIESACRRGGGAIDADTILSERSYDAALRAAGAAVWGVERLLAGDSRLAVTSLRPPGHHAESESAMGFCLFNNVAVGAAHAIEALGAERVLVLDWDVHHGNGTEEIFYGSERVTFVSIHEWPLYPGTGAIADAGTGAGEGHTINLPVPSGSGDELFGSLVQHVVAPVARELEPSLIAVSAGFDAHGADPLATCELTTSGYGELARAVGRLADELDVGVLVTLEGGYDRRALADSLVETIRGFGDGRAPEPAPAELAAPYAEHHRERWASLGA